MILTCWCLFVVWKIVSVECTSELWERDFSDDMKIGPSFTGYKRVDLKCGADHMYVSIKMDDEFSGVIYTRGSYSNRKSPCFRDPTKGTNFNMKIPLDSCNTKNDENGIYKNVLIVQHDDDLIMPGDAAFNLECDFRQPSDVDVSSSMNAELNTVMSKITIVDPDPGAKPLKPGDEISVSNRSQTVTFRPKRALRKEEL